jgi:hypothetical protein
MIPINQDIQIFDLIDWILAGQPNPLRVLFGVVTLTRAPHRDAGFWISSGPCGRIPSVKRFETVISDR